jgi:protein-disulfide isomerase
MRKLLLIPVMFLASLTYAQNCYSVKHVESRANIEGISPKRFTLGVKQITEEVISEKYSICEDGDSVSVIVESIEAPTTGVAIGPFEMKRKVTIVTTKININGKEYVGVGESKIDVKSTFIELQDENIPFEKSSFSAALKKSLMDGVNKI